ncbi:uncharacterized protein LOC111339194 [Stylophora pistillata]|uniref:uncharacterized protein LOC111339194 n=1 Tax=Stylophora pistillata TaxID=50429 RepID=UPI000C0489EB|nr:uncharacterized protein LOC111339194 [Stylophora pistillata]
MSNFNSHKNTVDSVIFTAEEKAQLLCGDFPRQITKDRLKQWLSCRKGTAKDGSARSDATKAELAQRVVSYIKNGWERNFTEKWKHLGSKQPHELMVSTTTATTTNNAACIVSSDTVWLPITQAKDIVPNFTMQHFLAYFIESKVKENESN